MPDAVIIVHAPWPRLKDSRDQIWAEESVPWELYLWRLNKFESSNWMCGINCDEGFDATSAPKKRSWATVGVEYIQWVGCKQRLGSVHRTIKHDTLPQQVQKDIVGAFGSESSLSFHDKRPSAPAPAYSLLNDCGRAGTPGGAYLYLVVQKGKITRHSGTQALHPRNNMGTRQVVMSNALLTLAAYIGKIEKVVGGKSGVKKAWFGRLVITPPVHIASSRLDWK
ncbi:hypothetical protein IW261DRAFT_1427248 [Armillaria novae-zelandiae]|uniref:Uncharacterized protein n=1 Tax=Armillaria novae-zelandiae TaxID=153914 RepID=A0AA39NHD4_9AGAR|nr:hypothetical protein IW261DRAFT_1427248 [Armillaria novae-zelandiae]